MRAGPRFWKKEKEDQGFDISLNVLKSTENFNFTSELHNFLTILSNFPSLFLTTSETTVSKVKW